MADPARGLCSKALTLAKELCGASFAANIPWKNAEMPKRPRCGSGDCDLTLETAGQMPHRCVVKKELTGCLIGASAD